LEIANDPDIQHSAFWVKRALGKLTGGEDNNEERAAPMELFDPQGQCLYLTREDREAFLRAAAAAPCQDRTFCLVLALTGCRISEALALTPKRIDLTGRAIIFETLKKRRRGVFRAVPVPADVLDTLGMVHGLQEAQNGKSDGALERRLWSWSRKTAYRHVLAVMAAARIKEGPHKCPKGLCHGYGVQQSARACRSTCSPSGWVTPAWRSPPSTPTPSGMGSTASRRGCGSDTPRGAGSQFLRNMASL
jgi:integrase/recombinase XerD